MALNTNTVQFIIYLATLVLAVGCCYGALVTRISTLESCAQNGIKDHDSVVSLIVKIDQISEDVKEIKQDLKELKVKIR